MPANARLPSGTLVELLCGQPEQKCGGRSARLAKPLSVAPSSTRRATRADNSASPPRARMRFPSRAAMRPEPRSEEHTSELQSLMRISYAVFCLKKKNTTKKEHYNTRQRD